jgi:hypothetical protein
MTSPPDLHWFVAVLVFESSIPGGWSEPSVDIQFRLVRAADAEAAFERAVHLGKQGEHAYENAYGQMCVWTFKGLKDLDDVLAEEFVDGVEIYGFIEKGSADDHVAPKYQLTAFSQGSVDDDPTASADHL